MFTKTTWVDRLCWLLGRDGQEFLAAAKGHKPGTRLDIRIDTQRFFVGAVRPGVGL